MMWRDKIVDIFFQFPRGLTDTYRDQRVSVYTEICFQFPRGLTGAIFPLLGVVTWESFQFPRGLTRGQLPDRRAEDGFQFPRGLTPQALISH